MASTETTFSADALLLQASREVLLLLDGQTLTILAANAAAARLLGQTEKSLQGQAMAEFECALSDIFFWDEMRGKTEASNVQSALRATDGSVIQVTKWVRQVSGTPLRYTVRAVPDSTQSLIEGELVNMGSRLRATLEATADGILLVDHEGNIINMNQHFSAMWGLPETLLSARDDEGIFAHLRAQCARGEPMGGHDVEATVFLVDGRVFECAVRPATSNGQVIGQVYSYRDMTERHRTQQELIAARDHARQANAAKSAFLAMMSHEIRTPMNGVLGVADLLAATSLDATQADYVRVIQTSGQTLLAILNDILDFSKIEAGKMVLERTLFSVQPLIDDVVALLRFRVQPGAPVLDCQVDADVPASVCGDPIRLRQILFNLVGNAFKFTERGTIRLRVHKLTDQADRAGQTGLKFTVQDTGIGMRADQLARLFSSFEQADSSISRKYGGTGLGLAICKRLAQLMGGQIGVESEEGVGSTFWFIVWLDAACGTVTETVAAVGKGPFKLDPSWRVLVVDDHPINRMVMRGIVRKLGGAEPDMADNGEIALGIASRKDFDLIFMDMQMPVMDGLQATRELRQRGFAAPIIGVSAGALDEESMAAIAAGADDYVHKPVTPASLSIALHRVFATRPSVSG